jgi:hypothetical protein
MHVIGFIPPIVGIESVFNTLRLGVALTKKLKIGDSVLLMDEKAKKIIGAAIVEDLSVGSLAELCVLHAQFNHTEIGKTDGQSGARLFALIQKLYGPHIAAYNKKSTVVTLRRVNYEIHVT